MKTRKWKGKVVSEDQERRLRRADGLSRSGRRKSAEAIRDQVTKEIRNAGT